MSLTTETKQELEYILDQFSIEGTLKELAPFGNGHINDTYVATYEDGGKTSRYILQRMNPHIFPEPEKLMENVMSVTAFLQEKIKAAGGNPVRETLCYLKTKDGSSFYSQKDEYFRVCNFIEGTTCYEQVDSPEIFYESAVAFGKFQSMLADYPADSLYETIPDFHNTPKRFQKFLQAVEVDACHRRQGVEKEIQFLLDRSQEMSVLVDLAEAGELPLRVTHNDTKLNNIMMDTKTKQGVCVIDLDTVMPGLSLYDFGDSIRFGASTASEDEKDLSKVRMSLPLYETYLQGYLKGCNGSLTKKELEMLPMGAKMMTMECGMRFLTDYLEGDHYFKIDYPEHNLDRTRTQLTLVADMEKKWDAMQDCMKKSYM